MSAPQKTEHVEWGVRYGDGEVDYWTTTVDGQTRPGDRSLAEETIERARADIAAGHADAEDYEPMTLVRRTVVEFAPIVGDWEEA